MKTVMHVWQRAMIHLATHPRIRAAVRQAPVSGLTRGLARRFVSGIDEQAAVSRARTLKACGISGSFFFLGEYVRDPEIIAGTLAALERAMAAAREAGLDLHISVDPTQAGLIQSAKVCRQNLSRLACRISTLARPGFRDLLMIDMEDSSVTSDTLALFHHLAARGLPAAVTLQACLHRTPDDLDRVMEKRTAVRLVKGAFAEGPDIALRPGRAVDRAYLSLARTLLDPDAVKQGVYPVFATHDHRLITRISHLAQTRHIPASHYEFEMLLGVRPNLQKQLAAQGIQVRVYLPFGRDFWPYAIRRVGENPKNIKFLLRSLAGN